MSRTNHARTKEKRKQLKLKNFFKRVIENRFEKAKIKPRGKTIYGNALLAAIDLTGSCIRYATGIRRNQRKRRKVARQTNNYKT